MTCVNSMRTSVRTEDSSFRQRKLRGVRGDAVTSVTHPEPRKVKRWGVLADTPAQGCSMWSGHATGSGPVKVFVVSHVGLEGVFDREAETPVEDGLVAGLQFFDLVTSEGNEAQSLD